jgi:hypothetical protein
MGYYGQWHEKVIFPVICQKTGHRSIVSACFPLEVDQESCINRYFAHRSFGGWSAWSNLPRVGRVR